MNKLKDLFEDQIYPLNPGHVRGSDTSLAAAESVAESAHSVRGKIFALITAAGPVGMTCDEIEVELKGRHQTISARVRELAMPEHGAKILDSGRRRPTRSQRMARVYIDAKLVKQA